MEVRTESNTTNLNILLQNIINGCSSDAECRVCFKRGEKLINMNEQFHIIGNVVSGKYYIADMLFAITSKKVDDTDLLSKKICESCIEKILSSFLFLKQLICTEDTIDKCISHLDTYINSLLESELKKPRLVVRLPLQIYSDYDLQTSGRETQRNERAEETVTKEKSNIEQDEDTNPQLKLQKKDLNVTNFYPEDTLASPVNKNCRKIYECTMCIETFINCSDYMKHRKEHPSGTQHICKKCNKTFVTSKCLQRHSQTHKDHQEYLCTQCGKYYATVYLYHSHFVSHKEKIYNCKACDKTFNSAKRVSEHHKYVHLKKRREYMCDLCGKILLMHNVFLTHLKIHQPLNCTGCSSTFNDKKTYNLHSCKFNEKINANQPKKYICDYCGYESMRKWNLAFHIHDRHLKSHEYFCDICKKKFYRKERLVRHRTIHAQLRPEECDICGNKFVNKRALLYHTRLHSGEKPFECEICGEHFVTKCRRLSHTKRKHMAPTVKCTHCNLLFYSNYTRNQHVKTVHCLS